MKKLLLGAMLLSSCTAANSGYQNVSVQDLKAALAKKDTVVIDVRTPEEYAAGHIKGAKLVPLQELPARASEVPNNAYIFCRSGNRSRQASEILVKAGKTGLKNVEGGMNVWVSNGFPTVR